MSSVGRVTQQVGRLVGVLLDLAYDPLGLAAHAYRASEVPHRQKHWVHLDAAGNVLAEGVTPAHRSTDPA